MSGAEDSGAHDAPRVAVVGAGPSGLYAAAAVLRGDPDVEVDVIDRLPAPYGLVRYGVAPDHPKIKSVTRVLEKPFADPRARFVGNVDVGRDVSYDDLRASYDALVYATGSQIDRPLAVPGAELTGNIGSSELVGWYSGHPDAPEIELTSPHVMVIGGGNVALDLARILARPAEDLRATDIPEQVLAVLETSAVTDVHIVVRRGPADSKFTYLELLDLDGLAGVDIVVHDDVRAETPTDLGEGPEADRVRRNLELFARWQDQPSSGGSRRVHFHFRRAITRLHGTLDRLIAVDMVPTMDSQPPVTRIDCGLVIRAIGYDAHAMEGLPFDADAGVVPHEAGRVLDGGVVVPGVYVTGWCKRGPTGVIATNKACATETSAALLADLPDLVRTRQARPDLAAAVDWAGWLRLDQHERSSGAPRGAERVKSSSRDLMISVASGQRSGV